MRGDILVYLDDDNYWFVNGKPEKTWAVDYKYCSKCKRFDTKRKALKEMSKFPVKSFLVCLYFRRKFTECRIFDKYGNACKTSKRE